MHPSAKRTIATCRIFIMNPRTGDGEFKQTLATACTTATRMAAQDKGYGVGTCTSSTRPILRECVRVASRVLVSRRFQQSAAKNTTWISWPTTTTTTPSANSRHLSVRTIATKSQSVLLEQATRGTWRRTHKSFCVVPSRGAQIDDNSPPGIPAADRASVLHAQLGREVHAHLLMHGRASSHAATVTKI